MRWMFLAVSLLCWAETASAASNEVLIVVADDRGLASAAVSAISQQYQGPVALAPTRWNGVVQPGSARLQISRIDARKWRLSLIGADASVAREISLPVDARQLDLAEAFALAVPGLVSKLDARSRAAKAREVEAIVQEHAAPKAPLPQLECPSLPAAAAASKPAAHPAAQSASAETAAATTVALPAAPDRAPSWSVGVTPGLFLSERSSVGYGAEATASYAFGSAWLARVSASGYSAHAWQYQIGMVPLDAFIGARADHGRFAAEIGLGGEVLIATSSIGTSVSVLPAAELFAGLRVTDGWLAGIRAIGAYTPQNTDIKATSDHNDIYLSQGEMRVGVVVQWELQ